ncbi:hypothetical protein [Sphingobium lactosutens]|uniref:Uncharacterized protein n=1 Tax=Sphingobium lactosutens DS20 TaxID=1331060 RepID=T0ISL6_9SPHN|nr:hypothetical protein [Sphingobium lactosutens]EQB12669.1 hypothetical protein RLDS_19360 [Sphingobium lactosutens DS20]
MKIPVGKIVGWIGRTLLGALISEAADRLSRSQPGDDRRDQRGEGKPRDQDRLDRQKRPL